MYKGYSELTALAPERYMDWESFETAFDSLPSNQAKAQDAYQKGLDTGKEFDTVFICANGTWGASRPNCQVTSCEGIGYHANTRHFWHGVLDSGTKVVVYRYSNWINGFVIQERLQATS